jgi:hypothetical protein
MKWLRVIIGLFFLVTLRSILVTPAEASDLSSLTRPMSGAESDHPNMTADAHSWPERVLWERRPEQPQPPPEPWRPQRRRHGRPGSGGPRRQPQRRRRQRGQRQRRTNSALSGDQAVEKISPAAAKRAESSAGVLETSVASGLVCCPEKPVATMPLSEWVGKELAAVTLKDARLERRLHKLVEKLAEQPTASIPQACGGWAETKAAYRFFDNSKVSHGAILAGHHKACLERVAEEGLLLVLQDTTSLDYTHHPKTRNVGLLENEESRGLFVHTSMAVSAAGVPLGLLDQQVWVRAPEVVGRKHQRKKQPIEEKESYKWLKGLQASLKDMPAQVCVVTVADREADIFDFFWEAEAWQTQVLVRAAWNRNLAAPSKGRLWEAVARTPVQGKFTVEIGRAKDRQPRRAIMAVRFTPVTIQPPQHRRRDPNLHPLPLYAIEVFEEDPPADEKPAHWLLLTNRPVQSFAQAECCVRWYSFRWLVERYHYVLKSGCLIEDRQLETGERLQRCLGVYAIVAWRLLWLTYQARVTPEAPCTVALQTYEWQALYCYIHGTSMPPLQPPSLNQAVRWIAQLGGFLGRKRDGEPGVKVLWRGWQRLNDIAETWQLTHPSLDVGNA